MARCKDCIHEKVCLALIKHGLPWNDEKYPAEKLCFEFLNKADVVPKSEVKCIYAYDGEVEEYCVQSPCPNYKTIEKAKQEVAREIFEEIDELLVQNATMQIATSTLHCKLAELKKKYTEGKNG